MTAVEPVDWALAERTAARLARRHPPPLRDDPTFAAELPALVTQAEELVAAETGLTSRSGPARVLVVDRPTWAIRNVSSFRGLLAPFVERQQAKFADSTSRLTHAGLTIGSRVTALELGALLGWMSARVLGQYELLMADDDGSDVVYVIGPNLVDIEARFGFDPAQFRLWIAIHEVTHRAQFTGVPWLRQFFLDQLSEVLSFGDRSSDELMATVRAAMADRPATRQRIADGGIAALLASDGQRRSLERLAGLMSLLEGHGEIVMNRAAGDLLPGAARFERVLGERRRRGNPLQRLTYRLIGFEGKINQYAAGSAFIRAIEAEAGDEAVNVCWQAPEMLPTLDEIRAPLKWLARTGTSGSTTPPPSTSGFAPAVG